MEIFKCYKSLADYIFLVRLEKRCPVYAFKSYITYYFLDTIETVESWITMMPDAEVFIPRRVLPISLRVKLQGWLINHYKANNIFTRVKLTIKYFYSTKHCK